jgi:hypothetical protein
MHYATIADSTHMTLCRTVSKIELLAQSAPLLIFSSPFTGDKTLMLRIPTNGRSRPNNRSRTQGRRMPPLDSIVSAADADTAADTSQFPFGTRCVLVYEQSPHLALTFRRTPALVASGDNAVTLPLSYSGGHRLRFESDLVDVRQAGRRFGRRSTAGPKTFMGQIGRQCVRYTGRIGQTFLF